MYEMEIGKEKDRNPLRPKPAFIAGASAETLKYPKVNYSLL